MVQKYVWWDDKRRNERVRLELRVPVAMREVLGELAQKNGVSINALAVGFFGYLLDADRRKRLSIDIVPNVRLTDDLTGNKTLDVTVPDIELGRRPTSGMPKAR